MHNDSVAMASWVVPNCHCRFAFIGVLLSRNGITGLPIMRLIDWAQLRVNGPRRLAAQGAVGREKTEPNPMVRGKGGVKGSLLTEAWGMPVGWCWW